MPTEIPYAHEVLEVTGGCTKCSPGCMICWAIKEVWRMAHNPKLGDKWQGLVEKKDGVLNWTGKIKCFEDVLQIPFKRKKPTTYFIDSKADLFHEKVLFSFTDRVFDMMYKCPQHTFLIFTKRPQQILSFVGEKGEYWRTLPNVRFFLSVSTQAEADEKIPILLQIPAAVRGLSIEPMLEGIEVNRYFVSTDGFVCPNDEEGPTHIDDGGVGVDGVVVGAESGPGARYCPIENIRGIVGQCKAANIPVFVKQVHLPKIIATRRVVSDIPQVEPPYIEAGKIIRAILNPHGALSSIMKRGILGLKPDEFKTVGYWLCKDINQFPKDLRIQQLPERK